ncbi:MAG: alpha/beta hydrolase [Microbacterium sp. SCN 70-200]|uniref:alpha/beta fold hydrolase n=1 Tax=unclassified Microbacterium TaxID=2609290 RepID=UPI00086EE97A|nr:MULTISPECIES: alpha/beta hydrolase [unclassified Microbacterium]MBN9215758.1 alpha/beta fold hydrolase [Microbacterium sp.]ODT39956.1 MAG: alpha/beta hydrolase [Microbacterium sp. SCN 70-200]OJV81981.1 MAG: alpha/beta hydrolase [Microbacterium sp. 70-16]
MTTATRQIFVPAESGGRAIPYVLDGEGPTVVLLPAAGLDIVTLGTLASILVEEDFRVLRVGSRRPAAGVTPTLHDLAQDVVDVMDHVGVTDAWIGGHALGGTLARIISVDHTDRVDGVIMLAAEGPTAPTAEATAALRTVFTTDDDAEALEALPALIGQSADAVHAWNIVKAARDADVVAMQDAAVASTASTEWTELAAGVPVLLVAGAEDAVSSPQDAEQLQAAAPDRVSVVRLDGVGHLFPVTHPGETSWVIEDYLDWD